MIRRLLLTGMVFVAALVAEPLRLHPENPHYYLFRGKPAVLITSGEHYGAVLNLDFNYTRYLETLSRDRLNLTRIFTGVYSEVPGSFQIASNTLAPTPGRFISPWQRAGDKFDLTKWDQAYFTRLKDFLRKANDHEVVVELVLFCPYYKDEMWEASPLNARNNINNIGNVGREEVLTLRHPELVKVQEAMVKKIVTELNGFDNLYYEICNEPYFGGVTLEWQAHIAGVIAETEKTLPKRHLIAQNIANGSRKIENPNPLVSIFNFHYSRPPESVAMNYSLNKAIGNNETGFDGVEDATYRIQGWEFLLAGGALYNNLDYSFAAGSEDGTFQYPPAQPGGGSTRLRRHLRNLHDLMDRIDFIHMKPDRSILAGGLPENASFQALVEPGKSYAVYIHHGRVVKDAKPRYQVDATPHHLALELELPAGTYHMMWVNPKSAKVEKSGTLRHPGGKATLDSPEYTEDIALRLTAN